MCDKFVDTFPFVSDSVSDWYKTQEMCYKFISEERFMLKCCLDGYKTQEMCDKAVDGCCQYWNLFLIGLLRIKYLKN